MDVTNRLKVPRRATDTVASNTIVPLRPQSRRRHVRRLFWRILTILALAPLVTVTISTLAVNLLWQDIAQGQPAPGFPGSGVAGRLKRFTQPAP